MAPQADTTFAQIQLTWSPSIGAWEGLYWSGIGDDSSERNHVLLNAYPKLERSPQNPPYTQASLLAELETLRAIYASPGGFRTLDEDDNNIPLPAVVVSGWPHGNTIASVLAHGGWNPLVADTAKGGWNEYQKRLRFLAAAPRGFSIEDVPPYEGFEADTDNTGTITTGTITVDADPTDEDEPIVVQTGAYRLICTAAGTTAAAFKLVAPNGKTVKENIGPGDTVDAGHLTFGALAVTTAVAVDDVWRIGVYRGTAWVKHLGSVYVRLRNTNIHGVVPGSLGNVEWGLFVDGRVPTAPATQGINGILTRNQRSLLDEHTVTLATGATAAAPILTDAEVPVAEHGHYDAVILFAVSVDDTLGGLYYVTLAELESLPANDAFDIGRAFIIYESEDTSFSLRLFKRENGDLAVHKRGGSGSTEFSITATYFYWTETYERVALAIHDIIDEGWADEGYLSGVSILGPVRMRTETDTPPATPTGGTVTATAITAAPDGWTTDDLRATAEEHFVWAAYCLHRSDNSKAWLHPILEAQSTALRQTVTTVASHTGQIITAGDNNNVGPLPAAGGLDERILVSTRVVTSPAGAWNREWVDRSVIDAWTKSDDIAVATTLRILDDDGLQLDLYRNAAGTLRVHCVTNTNTRNFDLTVKSYRIVEGMERVQEAIRAAGRFTAERETKLDGLANVKTIGHRLTLSDEGELSAGEAILTRTEASLASAGNLTLLPNVSSGPLISNANLPADNADWFDDRIRIRAGRDGETLTETWTTPVAVRTLIPSDTYTVSESILLHTQDGIELRLRRRALGDVIVTRFGGTGAVTFEVHIERQYFVESEDRVAEAMREIVGEASVPPARLVPADGGNVDDVLTQTSNTAESIPAFRPIPRKLPPVAGQFAVYRRVETALADPTDLASGRLQFYSSGATGGTNGNDREVLGTRWRDILGNATNGLGFTTQNSKRRFMLVHRTEFRNRNLSPFYHQLGYHYWTYPLQVMVFAGHGQWVLFSGNLIGNSAEVAANHCNFFLERVIDFDLSAVTPDGVIPTDLQIKWGYQGDTDTILSQRVPHTRYRLGGANQPTLPTLADWDGNAFATGNANQTTEQPPAQDESTSTHLWVFTAVSTRTAGRDGVWSTTTWAARRATDPDSTTFSAQWSADPAGNESASGPWWNRAQDAGLSGTIRFRLDNGDWFYASYGPPPNPPTLEVEYSATETGGYSSTVRTEGYYRFKLSTETTWAGPFLLANSPPTIDVEYSANQTGPWSTTVRTTGWFRWKLSTETTWSGPFEIANNTVPTTQVQYSATKTGTFTDTVRTSGWYRWKLSTETDWTGPFEIPDNSDGPAPTIPTLDVQYSATETGTYTSTVRTEGFYRFRYDNGPWIGPNELGATPIPAAPEPSALPWTQMFAYHMPIPTSSVVHDLVNVDDLDEYDEIEFRTQRTGTDGAVATYRMRIAEIPVTNWTASNLVPTGNPVKLTHTRDGLQVSIGSEQTEAGSQNGRSVGLIYFQRASGVTTGRRVKRIWHRGLQISSAGELHTTAYIR